METLWRIELLGDLRAISADRVLTRFRSRKAGALLAYLAFYRDRAHPRDLLTDLLWPDEPRESARSKLWTALSSLRRQLEPPGTPTGTVILATRLVVRLDPAAVTTDVAAFETALAAAARARGVDEQSRRLDEAIALSRGPLLPGYYEAWILPEQQRLSEQLSQALCQMIGRLEQAGQFDRALEYARRAVAVDPLREEAHYDLIRLYAAAGQVAAARRQYREWERLLGEELHEEPASALQELMQRLDRGELPALPSGLSPPLAPAGPADQTRAVPSSLPPAVPRPPERGDEARGYLPPTLNRFFGREAEIARLRKLLLAEGVRLVTLTGPGGSGKTRLALEAVARLRDPLDGAVWFVPLADLLDPHRIIDAVHAALRLPRRPNVEPMEQVAEALSRRPCLLLLDNFEQLMPEGGLMVRDLLERIPLLQCLVTSRRILELTPEREISVEPLPVPVESGKSRVERPAKTGSAEPPALNSQLSSLNSCESVAMFVDRAQAAMPDFQLTPTNAAAVAELCRRLEGIPLAIELAAARAQRLSPSRMLAQLERRFDLLVSRKRDLSRRHQTLRAALDWSYQLLPPEVQRFFARLFVFRGGFTLEAAAAVAGTGGEGEGQLPDQVRDNLAELHGGSLVLIEEWDGQTRHRMLETLREFAAEQLSADERAAGARRHSHYYLSLAETAVPELNRTSAAVWLDRLDSEHDNLRAALDWLGASGETEAGLRLGAVLARFWSARGYLTEGRQRLTALLGLTRSSRTAAKARTLNGAGILANLQGDFEAIPALCEPSLAIARELGDPQIEWVALHRLASVWFRSRNDLAAARALWEEGLAVCRKASDRRGAAVMLQCLGAGAIAQGDHAAARALTEESQANFRDVGDQQGLGATTIILGVIARDQGDYPAARSLFEQALVINRALRNPDLVAQTLYDLGTVAQRQGDAREARALYEECLAILREVGTKRGVGDCLSRLEEVAKMPG